MVADLLFMMAAFYLDVLGAMNSVIPFVGAVAAAMIDLFRACVEFIYNVASMVSDNVQFTLGELQTHPTDLARMAQQRADANMLALVDCALLTSTASRQSCQANGCRPGGHLAYLSVCTATYCNQYAANGHYNSRCTANAGSQERGWADNECLATCQGTC